MKTDQAPFRPYSLSEEAFDLLEDVRAALQLFGMMAVEQNSGAGGIPAEAIGRTVLMLGNQLDQVVGDCQHNAKPSLRAVHLGGVQ